MKYKIEKIEIEKGSQEYTLTSDILKRLKNIPVDYQEAEKEKDQSGHHLFDMHKDKLRLLSFKGEF